MGSSNTNLVSILVVVAAAAAAVIGGAEGQSTPSCAQNLIPCAQYLNTTGRPPSSCCDPLSDTVKNQLKCLCDLYATPGFLQSLGININQALQLPGRCGIPGDLSACNGNAAESPSSPSNVPPPPAASGNSKSHGLSLISWNGMSILALLWASMMH